MRIKELPISIRKKDNYGITDLIKHFANTCPGDFIFLQPDLISDVIEEIGHVMADTIINQDELHLPYGLGTIKGITKSQKLNVNENGNPVHLRIDPVATNKLWEEKPELRKVKFVYYLNDDLTYNCFSWVKMEDGKKLKNNLIYYKFKPIRKSSRLMASAAKAGKRYMGAKLKNI